MLQCLCTIFYTLEHRYFRNGFCNTYGKTCREREKGWREMEQSQRRLQRSIFDVWFAGRDEHYARRESVTFQIFAPNNKKLNTIQYSRLVSQVNGDCLSQQQFHIENVADMCKVQNSTKDCRLNHAVHGNDRGNQFKSSFLYKNHIFRRLSQWSHPTKVNWLLPLLLSLVLHHDMNVYTI